MVFIPNVILYNQKPNSNINVTYLLILIHNPNPIPLSFIQARTASSSSESEEGADDVDDDEDEEDDSSSRSNRIRQMKSEDDSAISKSSESAAANKNYGNDSSSDTEDDAGKDIADDDDDEAGVAAAPVPMARKASAPLTTDGELTKEEFELSKRETVNVEEVETKISEIEVKEDSESEEEEVDVRKRTYSSSEEEEEEKEEEEKPIVKVEDVTDVVARSLSSVSEEADDGHPIIVDADFVQPRANGGAEIRRPQFRHSASSLSDEEIQIPSETSPKHKIEERKQQLAAAASEVERPPSSQSPLPTRANAEKIAKMYTAAVENNNNDNGGNAPTERSKPSKDITQIYTQAMAKTSTPPASPKPVPSKNRGDITQLYTGGISTKPSGNTASPCIVADKLSPKKVNMLILFMLPYM